MYRLSAILILILTSWSLLAQLTVDVNATGRHQETYEGFLKAKHSAEQLKGYLSIDTTSITPPDKERMSQKIDSAAEARFHSDSSLIAHSLRDSMIVYMNLLAEAGELEELQMIHDRYVQISESGEVSIDAIANTVAGKLVPHLPDAASPDLQSMLPVGMNVTPDLPTPPRFEEIMNNISPEQLAKGYVDAQGLKSKYQSLSNSNEPELGIKKNSLKQYTFKQRLAFRGNIGFRSTDPVIMDNSLSLAYRINKLWMMGAGGHIREDFGKTDTLSVRNQDQVKEGYGYHVFASYDIFFNFFIYAEYRRICEQSLFDREKYPNRPGWQTATLVGIGRAIHLFKQVDLTVTLMYDFNHRNSDLHQRPWVFEVGYRVKKLPFVSKVKEKLPDLTK